MIPDARILFLSLSFLPPLCRSIPSSAEFWVQKLEMLTICESRPHYVWLRGNDDDRNWEWTEDRRVSRISLKQAENEGAVSYFSRISEGRYPTSRTPE